MKKQSGEEGEHDRGDLNLVGPEIAADQVTKEKGEPRKQIQENERPQEHLAAQREDARERQQDQRGKEEGAEGGDEDENEGECDGGGPGVIGGPGSESEQEVGRSDDQPQRNAKGKHKGEIGNDTGGGFVPQPKGFHTKRLPFRQGHLIGWRDFAAAIGQVSVPGSVAPVHVSARRADAALGIPHETPVNETARGQREQRLNLSLLTDVKSVRKGYHFSMKMHAFFMASRGVAAGLALSGALIFSSGAAVAQEAEAEATAAPAGEAAVEGSVKLSGPAPEPKEVQMVEANLAGVRESECAALHQEPVLDNSVVVGEDGGLKNVFVYVKDGLPEDAEWPVPEEAAVLDQQGCLFVPHVMGVRAGQKIEIKNSDPLVHNVRSFPDKNRPFNIGTTANTSREKEFRRAEKEIKIKCDIHKWMTSWIFSMEHPFYAVTDESGSFKIEGLPAGDYTLAAWHEVYGEQTQDVTVGEDGVATAEFTFESKAEEAAGETAS